MTDIGQITRINGLVEDMCRDDKFRIVRYSLRCIKEMCKEMTMENCEMHLEIDQGLLVIPAYIEALPDEAVKWMLLHEAAHLASGDDVTLKRVVEVIDHCQKSILDTLHAVMERNANILTIKTYGGIQEDMLVGSVTVDPEKMKPIPMRYMHKLVEDVQTTVKIQTKALQKALESV
jgi:hypothetical protein